MRRLVDLMHRKFSGLHESALLLGITALISQVMGFIIYRLLVSKFGASAELDVFYAAFRVPDFLYATVASFVAVTVLVPFIAEKTHEGEERLREFVSTVFTVFSLAMITVCAIAYVLMPWLAKELAPGFSILEQAHYVEMARILLLSPLFLGLSNLFGSVTQSLQRFVVFAAGPILYNIGMLIGILWLYPEFGSWGLAGGVAIGAFMHMGIQLPVLARSKLLPHVSLSSVGMLPRIARVSILRTIALSSSSISMMVLTALASKTNGAVTIFTLANSLQGITHTVIGMSYSVAAFPTLSRLWAAGDKHYFRAQLVNASRHIVFWALPITALSIVLRAQIVRVLFGAGRFGWGPTKLVAAALALFVLSAVAQSLVLLFTRALYAIGDNRRALVANLTGAVVTIVTAYGIDAMMASGGTFQYFLESILRVEGVAGTSLLALPLAYSIGVFVSLVMLVVSLEKHSSHIWLAWKKSAYQSFAVAVIMGYVGYHTLGVVAPYIDQNTFVGIATQGLVGGLAAIFVGVVLFVILENREYEEVSKALRSKMLRSARPIAVEQETL